MPDQNDRPGLTRRSYIAVLAFFAAVRTFPFWATPWRLKQLPLKMLVPTMAVDAIRYVAIVLIAALFIRAFWNRLVSDVLAVRSINYTEAVAAVLVKGLLFMT
jgi:hypothetical protein